MKDLIGHPSTTETTKDANRSRFTLRRALSIATLALLLLLIPLSATAEHGFDDPPDPGSEDGVRGVVLTGGHVVDYKNGWDEKRDIAFSCPRGEGASSTGGRITHVSGKGEQFVGTTGYKIVNASELLILPGHVDSHVHLAYETLDRGTPYRRGLEALVANGVTTALDVGSIPKTLTEVMVKHGEGVGLTMGSLYGLRPKGTIPEEGAVDPEAGAEVDCERLLEIEAGTENDDPSYETLKAVLYCALEQGGLV